MGLRPTDAAFAFILQTRQLAFSNYQNHHPPKRVEVESELGKYNELKVSEWKKISSDFTNELIKQWEDKGFNWEQGREWNYVGLQPAGSDCAAWLRDIKGKNAEWFLECADKKALMKEFLKWKIENKENNVARLNAQEWLDREYTKSQRRNITELDITPKQFERSQIDFQFERSQIKKFNPALSFLLAEERKSELEELMIEEGKVMGKIKSRVLEGSLKLEGFVNLEELHCSDNQLTNLDVGDCPDLRVLDCSDNLLTSLNLSRNQLEELNIMNNNFAEQDLSFLSHLFNLKYLFLGNNNKEKVIQSVYNRFFGSLESLENMNKLELLEINDTDINTGLEHLPDGIQMFCCSVDLRKNAKVKDIYKLFADEQGVVEVNDGGWIENFPQKFSKIKTRISYGEDYKYLLLVF